MTNPDTVGDMTWYQAQSTEYETLGLKTFEYTDRKDYDVENDIDTENNFFVNTQNQCQYYTEEQFSNTVKVRLILRNSLTQCAA